MKKNLLSKILTTTASLMACSLIIGNTISTYVTNRDNFPVSEQTLSEHENVPDIPSPQNDDEEIRNNDE